MTGENWQGRAAAMWTGTLRARVRTPSPKTIVAVSPGACASTFSRVQAARGAAAKCENPAPIRRLAMKPVMKPVMNYVGQVVNMRPIVNRPSAAAARPIVAMSPGACANTISQVPTPCGADPLVGGRPPGRPSGAPQ